MAIVKATRKNAPDKTKLKQENPSASPVAADSAADRQSTGAGKPAPAQTKNPNRLQTAVDRNSGILRTIKGYKGMAVINSDGKVLAADLPEESIDFNAVAEAVNRMHMDCSKHLGQKGMGPCNGLTLHTPQGLLSMRTTDLYAGGNYRFIAALSEEGNGHFLQVQLKTIIPKIMSELSNPG